MLAGFNIFSRFGASHTFSGVEIWFAFLDKGAARFFGVIGALQDAPAFEVSTMVGVV